ncbi:mast cell protease 1A-like [Salvelinus alpinus]
MAEKETLHAGRIYGGKEAVPHSRPYMVLLEKAVANNLKPGSCCGFLLEEIAVFTDHVRPIGLPLTKDEEVPKECLVSGWGHTIRNLKQGSPVLQDLNVTLDENQLCSDNHQVCSSGLNGPAQGDYGGPSVCNGVAYGVVSTKTRNNTYIYMRIPDFLDWINDTMKN